jgi:N-methylhydantoinase B
MTFPMTIVDTIFKAMEQAIPDRVIAGHHADLMVSVMNGISQKDGRLFIASTGPLGGGWGAKISEDGVSATVCLNDGDTHNSPVEHAEAKVPILIERHALRNDSGGAGRFRGGLGVEQTVQVRSPLTVNLQIDRVHCAPWGLAQGHAGFGNRVTLRIGGKEITDLPNAKVLTRELRPGDAFTVQSGGGGGFGPPWERDVESVTRDVRQEYVSREAARDIYGVVFQPGGAVDISETTTLRKHLSANKNSS